MYTGVCIKIQVATNTKEINKNIQKTSKNNFVTMLQVILSVKRKKKRCTLALY